MGMAGHAVVERSDGSVFVHLHPMGTVALASQQAFDARGFVFYTNLESTKAKQISENPNVALLFYWREFERQVKIRGRATRLGAADVAKYFFSRPRDSRIAAWASPQSHTISARQILEQKFDEMKRKFAEGEVPVPSFWGGYTVAPRTIEFWQGGEHRLHDRFQYADDVDLIRGRNGHHAAEAIFKAFAVALRSAKEIVGRGIPSTKGVI